MHQYITIFDKSLIKIVLIIFTIFSLILLFFIINKPKIISSSEYSLYSGNVGIGESPPGPIPTPTATPSATPTPSPTPLPTPPSDTEAPIVNLTNPANGSSVSGSVEVRAEASDSGGIANVGFAVDGNIIGTDTSAPYSVLWDTAIYPHNSVHTLLANALDTSGNQASSSAVTVTVLDITPPSVTITNPLDGSTVPKNSTVTITANASDISGVNQVEFYVNGVLKCTDTTSSHSCNWKVPPRKNVIYTLQAKAFDVVGNSSTAIATVTSK